MNVKTCIAIIFAVFVLPLTSQAQVEKSLCIYDPAGKDGALFGVMKEYQLEALNLGVKFKLVPQTNEKTAADEFRAKQCDAVMITGTRARPFHKLGGTFEAMGALPTYKLLRKAIKAFSKKKAAKFMKSGEYENAGIFPAGAVYLFVNDKSLNSVEALAGKRLATLTFDEAAKTMVDKVGASMVAADVSTFHSMFNNGAVDACYSPAFGYQALELFKGIGDKGGVIGILGAMTMQLLIRSQDGYPEGLHKPLVSSLKGSKKSIKMAKKLRKPFRKSTGLIFLMRTRRVMMTCFKKYVLSFAIIKRYTMVSRFKPFARSAAKPHRPAQNVS